MLRQWALVADELGLEQRVERLSERVVVAVTGRADRRDHTGVGEPLGVAQGEVLHALVRVVDQALRVAVLSLAGPQAHLQRVEGEVGAQTLRQLPAHDTTAEHVDDEGGVDPAGERAAVGVGSDRGAAPGFHPVRFPGPPAEPDVRLPPHPALHVITPRGRVILSSMRLTMALRYECLGSGSGLW